MRLEIPDPSLVLLVGPTSSGKSSFARRHFRPTEVVSSDACRAAVSDDENDQSATEAAFRVVHLVTQLRLDRARLTVVDATNVRPDARAPLVAIARRAHLPVCAVVLDLPAELCEARRRARTDRDAPPEAVVRQRDQLHRALGVRGEGLLHEGVQVVHLLRTPEEVAAAELVRVPLPPDRRAERGPFDVVGDVHGCGDELEALLARLGYAPDAPGADAVWRHPAGRRVVFVGDLVDRGPRVVDVLRLAMAGVAAGAMFAVPGNHDDKLLRALRGHAVQRTHGLAETMAAVEGEGPAFAARVRDFVGALPSHLVLDGGGLVVAHGGLPLSLHGRDDRHVRDRALFGEVTGARDQYDLPVRVDWAARYAGAALVAYGHTPVLAPRWKHDTVDLDTGCVFGGALTALRWPERETVSEPARRRYAVPGRPISADPFVAPEAAASGARAAARPAGPAPPPSRRDQSARW
jgi:protein phosphatase